MKTKVTCVPKQTTCSEGPRLSFHIFIGNDSEGRVSFHIPGQNCNVQTKKSCNDKDTFSMFHTIYPIDVGQQHVP